jgi:magnesium-transporting ATPase (P-type)
MSDTRQLDPAAASFQPAGEWYQLPVEDVLQRLGSSVDGVSSTEAARRLAEVGPNELARPDKPSVLKLALVQVSDPMNLMLLALIFPVAVEAEKAWRRRIRPVPVTVPAAAAV